MVHRVIASIMLGFGLLLLQGCASLPQNFSREEIARLNADDTTLAQEFAQLEAAHPGQSGAYPLGSGMEALAARVGLARRAERSLDVQYYIWHGDNSGRILLKELLDAADRGVRVRLLLDDLGVGAKDDSVFRLLDAHPLVSVVLFNPIALREARKLGMLSDPRRLNRRMHNKSMTADSTVTVVGGRNIGDEYFSLNELVNFADLDVLAIGPVASQVSESFDAYWNSSAAFPINAFHDQPVTAEELAQGRADLEQAVARNAAEYYQAMAATPLGLKIAAGQLNFYWAEITALYDTPNKARLDQPDEAAGDPGPDLLLQQLGNLLGHSKSELLIVSPYFVPGKQGTAALVAAAQRGIKVRVVTNSLASTDVAAVHAGYKDSRRDLLEGGVQMYEMKPALDAEQSGKLSFTGSSAASLHAKLFVIDLERLFVGSMNLDPRSVQLNTEIGLLIDSSEMAGDVGENIKRMLDTACYSVQLQPKRADRPDGRQKMVWIETREGKSVRHDQEPQTSAWQRFKVGFIGIFPIDSQL